MEFCLSLWIFCIQPWPLWSQGDFINLNNARLLLMVDDLTWQMKFWDSPHDEFTDLVNGLSLFGVAEEWMRPRQIMLFLKQNNPLKTWRFINPNTGNIVDSKKKQF